MTTDLPSRAPQNLDPQDTLGEYYSAIDWKGEHILEPNEVGTYFGPTASAVYSSCTGAGSLPASWATSALFLLETSTQRINAQVEATSSLPAPVSTTSIPAPVQPCEASATVATLETSSGVHDATVLVTATAANSMVTSHITISFTHPSTVASWAEAAQNLIFTHVTISTPDATPTTSTVDGDAVADLIASISVF